MRIEHLAIWTRHLEELREFYTCFFAGEAGGKYVNQNTGFESYFIAFEGGARLELMRLPHLSDALVDSSERPGLAHLAFTVGLRGEVDSLSAKLDEAGYALLSSPRLTGDGYYEACVADPDGNRVEILAAR